MFFRSLNTIILSVFIANSPVAHNRPFCCSFSDFFGIYFSYVCFLDRWTRFRCPFLTQMVQLATIGNFMLFLAIFWVLLVICMFLPAKHNSTIWFHWKCSRSPQLNLKNLREHSSDKRKCSNRQKILSEIFENIMLTMMNGGVFSLVILLTKLKLYPLMIFWKTKM